MARILQTPSVIAITPFDPSYDYSIEFIYNDSQSVSNRVVITDNETSTIVYDNTQSTMRLWHVVAANTLTPGKQYLAQVQVFDADGNHSILSDPIMFYCYSTPTFEFDGLVDGMTHKSATITIKVGYEQAENEALRSFQFFKYSSDKALVTSSDIVYSSTVEDYTFYGLNNSTLYYFRATGETTHGIKLDTGYVGVNIDLELVPATILFDLENNRNEGYINVVSNINDIDYETENDNYIFEDDMLILNGSSINYNQGLQVSGDFSLFVEAKKLPMGTFLTTDNGNLSLSIVEIVGARYCKLTVIDSNYQLYAPLPDDVDADFNQLVVFELKRKGVYYSLKAYQR